MRIVAGKHRGRKLLPPVDLSTRPTGDKARQAIFTILEHAAWAQGRLRGAIVLDAFCGTGALGLEAISRGVAQAFFMDNSSAALDVARRNAQAMKEESHSTFILADAIRPPAAVTACDLVFLDPPYGQGLAPQCVAALAKAGWLKPNTILVIETARSDPWPEPSKSPFTLIDSRTYGKAQVRFMLWQKS